MRLVSITQDDLPFMQRMQCDPELMVQLSGPTMPEDFPELMQRMLKAVETNTGWVLKIFPNANSDVWRIDLRATE